MNLNSVLKFLIWIIKKWSKNLNDINFTLQNIIIKINILINNVIFNNLPKTIIKEI